MRCVLALLLLVACDAQVDSGYAGEPVALLHATAVGFRPGDFADGAAVRWNPQIGTDLSAGPTTPLPLEPIPPSELVIPVSADPPPDAYFSFAGEAPRIAEGMLFLTSGGENVASSIDVVLVHVDGSVEPGGLAATYLGGVPGRGFHLAYARATAELTPAQAYLAMVCGGGDACRTPRLYRLVIPGGDLATQLQFFRSGR
jgi:hypothetical protein